jgi:hypothetical protein
MSHPLWPKFRWLAVALPVLAFGCAQLDLNQSVKWPFMREEEPGIPDRVMAMWTDTVLTHSEHPPTRGFGGRLMFYGADGTEPIKVDGSLVVYAFDERGGDSDDVKPDRKYVLTPEQLAKHHSESEMGHSYSVWLPWDEVGGTQKEISLIVRFLPVDGGLVIGEPSKHLLPGRTEIPENAYVAPTG